MDTSTSNPYIKKAEDGRLVITQEGEEFLKRIVTDPKGQVYVFTNEAPPLIVAAAMARTRSSVKTPGWPHVPIRTLGRA